MGMFSTDLLSQVSEKMTNSKDLLFKGQQVFHLEICHRPGSAPTVPSSFFTVKLSKNENDPVGLRTSRVFPVREGYRAHKGCHRLSPGEGSHWTDPIC